MNDGGEQNQREDLKALLVDRIENLRRKLLDLSRRNPLISAKLGPRSGSSIRIVDELPDVLAYNLLGERRMRFAPLPALEEDPKDEQNREFQAALSEARMTDEIFSTFEENFDPDAADALERLKAAERDLRDRVRDRLGMPPHASSEEISVIQHAKNNGISPSYELPIPDDEHEDGRHTDSDIQTLLLPNDLERKLTGILTKCRTWVQETGINVLQVAFGLYEWKDPKSDAICLAPLVLAPVEVEKVRTRDGAEFWVKGLGEDAETNLVLSEKLKNDFGIDLQQFDGGSIEDYLSQISEDEPPGLAFRIRRQVVFGVFPSARMAMFHDLDTAKHNFDDSDIVKSLFVGSEDNGASPFADEYAVDEPEIEQKVPNTVLDSDSSQFSALVDVADGRNVALEGPPGTGKSQTIVNAISSALSQGKKVLFVAEKMAALEVVKSRLEAVGLGEFVLPLQAERSTKEQVIQSLRNRVEMSVPRGDQEYGVKIERFKEYRSDLAEYIHVLSTEYGRSELTVFEVLGKAISTQQHLSGLPRDFQRLFIENVEQFTSNDLQIIQETSERLSAALEKTKFTKDFWRGHSLQSLDTFIVEDLFDLIDAAITAGRKVENEREEIGKFNILAKRCDETILVLEKSLQNLIELGDVNRTNLIETLLQGSNLNILKDFKSDIDELENLLTTARVYIREPEEKFWADTLNRMLEICDEFDFECLNINRLSENLIQNQEKKKLLNSAAIALAPFMDVATDCRQISLQLLKQIGDLIEKTPRNALALRSDLLAQREAAMTIQSASNLAERLRIERDDLKSVISVTPRFSSDELRKIASILAGSGGFSFLSSTYRNAKKAYSTISIRPSLSKDNAATDLRALANWQEEIEKFKSISGLQNLLGSHYQELDTDFTLFGELLDFYEAVEQQFPRIENIASRTFLKSADLEILTAIPDFEIGDWEGNFDELQKFIQNQDELENSIKGGIEELRILQANMAQPFKGSTEELRKLTEEIASAHDLYDRLNQNLDAARILDGSFNGAATDVKRLAEVVSATEFLLACNEEFRPALLDLIANDDIQNCLSTVQRYIEFDREFLEALSLIAEKTGVPVEKRVEDASYENITLFLVSMKDDQDGLYAHAELERTKTAYVNTGMPDLVGLLEAYEIQDFDIVSIGDALIARSLSRRVYEEFGPKLTKYDGETLNDLRRRLAKADRELIRLSRSQLRRKVQRAAAPPSGNRVGKKSTWTEWSLIENEINKKKRFVPIRDLTARAGRALLELKPCWMMSPLAVAQYLQKGGVNFDLCIIDEASQMPPEDAIGALTRCEKALVVGDTNQLPPTSFFRRMIDDEDADEDEAVLEESILEMANAAFRPKRRLRWHYRSRHSGLIQFSNRLIYEDDLIVFPSANEDRKDMGVSYVKVEGSYKAGVNGPEASTIIDATLDFMFRHPDRSLGIVTLNQKQRDLIIEDFEFAIRKSPWAAKYVDEWKERNDSLESFFIKNLENVQGDERDVIFIGTVYGPSEPGGPVMQRFGPINGLAGQRRLNVLFSRAKEQIVTFSSMTAADIRADEHGNPGTYMLKRWLEYAATGVLEGGVNTQKEPDSDFEVFVIDQIRSMGCEAVPQVGVAGYFIDIGVKHPEWPHGFILGVECDGASYHSSKSARDRDRLRQEVLENLGWRFHRIWSTDWFNDPSREADRLRNVIHERLDKLKATADDFEVPSSSGDEYEKEEIIEEDLEEVDLFAMTDEVLADQVAANFVDPDCIAIGDTVRIRYLSGDEKVVEFQLSDNINDPDNGIVSRHEPIGEAILECEEGEEVEFLAGSYVKKILIEKVTKPIEDKNSSTINDTEMDAENVTAARNDIQQREKSEETYTKQAPTNAVGQKLSADRFYNDDYIFVIRKLGLEIIDSAGPITYRHLSERIARLHGFQRTGSEIRKRVWAAVSKERKAHKDAGPKGENIFWPKDMEPVDHMKFRGMRIAGEERSWQQVPYPEKLGLAIEIISYTSNGDHVEAMARRIGLARLAARTRSELEELLDDARRMS